jgi:hypothetical protein
LSGTQPVLLEVMMAVAYWTRTLREADFLQYGCNIQVHEACVSVMQCHETPGHVWYNAETRTSASSRIVDGFHGA